MNHQKAKEKQRLRRRNRRFSLSFCSFMVASVSRRW